jgi:hypothetical protein
VIKNYVKMCEEDGCCRSLVKVLFIIVNILFLLAGLLMLALGISLVVAPEKVLKFAESGGLNFSSFNDTSDGYFLEIIKACGIFMIILGGVVAIVAFLGFVGACCESQCLLVTYAIILIIIVLAEVALIIFAAVYPTVFRKSAADLLNKSLNDYGEDARRLPNNTIDFTHLNDNGVGLGWIAIQTAFNCCGSLNSTDYKNNAKWKTANPGQVVPLSCCKLKPGKELGETSADFVDLDGCQTSQSSTSTNTNGCTDAIMGEAEKLLKKYGTIAIGIAAGIVGLELIMITLAFVLCCRQRSSKYV